MRLRPFGDSGPLVTSLASLEDYFVAPRAARGSATRGSRRAWSPGPARACAERVEPFVYRRYLDYGMLERCASCTRASSRPRSGAARPTTSRWARAASARSSSRCSSSRWCAAGATRGCARPRRARALAAHRRARASSSPRASRPSASAYEFLRRLEHRLQYYDDQQTQALPRDAEHRALIAEAMDFADWDALAARARPRTARRVQEAFDALFEAQRAAPRARREPRRVALRPAGAARSPRASPRTLARGGHRRAPRRRARASSSSRARARYRALSAACRARSRAAAAASWSPRSRAEGGREAAAARLIDLARGDRRARGVLLAAASSIRRCSRARRASWRAAPGPRGSSRATRSCWTSSRAAPRASPPPTGRPSAPRSARECAALAGDVERLLDHLRHYKQRQVLRFTIADLEGELPVMALSDELSALADTILDVTLARRASAGLGPVASGDGARARRRLLRRRLRQARRQGAGLRLRPRHRSSSTTRRCAAEAEQLARVAQRVNTWMTSLTAGGRALRDRPAPAARRRHGPLVSSLAAFRDYQLKRAWTWEHQALTRARACAGDRGARRALRGGARRDPRAAARAREALRRHRRDARARCAPSSKREAQDLKHVAGGMIDLEFCVQALVLAARPRAPGAAREQGQPHAAQARGRAGPARRGASRAARRTPTSRCAGAARGGAERRGDGEAGAGRRAARRARGGEAALEGGVRRALGHDALARRGVLERRRRGWKTCMRPLPLISTSCASSKRKRLCSRRWVMRSTCTAPGVARRRRGGRRRSPCRPTCRR